MTAKEYLAKIQERVEGAIEPSIPSPSHQISLKVVEKLDIATIFDRVRNIESRLTLTGETLEQDLTNFIRAANKLGGTMTKEYKKVGNSFSRLGENIFKNATNIAKNFKRLGEELIEATKEIGKPLGKVVD